MEAIILPKFSGHRLESPAGISPVLEQGRGVDPVNQPLDGLRGGHLRTSVTIAQYTLKDMHFEDLFPIHL